MAPVARFPFHDPEGQFFAGRNDAYPVDPVILSKFGAFDCAGEAEPIARNRTGTTVIFKQDIVAFEFLKTDAAAVQGRKQAYLRRLTAPLDGMWESFVAQADHYDILHDEELVGFCVINSNRQLLQFYDSTDRNCSRLFQQMLFDLNIAGAIVATCDSPALALCMDHQKAVSVNAFLYQAAEECDIIEADFPAGSDFRLLESDQLKIATTFCRETLGDDLDWLEVYLAERIARQELFGLWQDQEEKVLIATGECRPSDTQKPYADLGMIVSKRHRNQGIATAILHRLVQQCVPNGLKPICSTERENLAARKAIEKAGFVSHHRILQVRFDNSGDNRE